MNNPLFATPKPVPHVSWQTKGGPGRQHDVLMELQLNKVRQETLVTKF